MFFWQIVKTNQQFARLLERIKHYTNIDFYGGEYVVIYHSQERRIDRACEVNTSFSGVTYNHVFTDTKSQYLFYYILPVKPLNIGSQDANVDFGAQPCMES